jgi:hypothetical protein
MIQSRAALCCHTDRPVIGEGLFKFHKRINKSLFILFVLVCSWAIVSATARRYQGASA